MRIGIDVGGTNTDAVLVDGDTVVAAVKVPTTPEATSGIVAAIRSVSAERPDLLPQIDSVMIGTTRFINALVEGRQLARTAVLRLGLPATQSLPPFCDWPAELVDSAGGIGYLVHGGHEFTGRTITHLDPDEIRRVADDMLSKGVQSVAVSAVFSPISAEHELRAGEILAETLGSDLPVSYSHRIGRLGLLERENATAINAALRLLADDFIRGLEEAVSAAGVAAPLFLSRNDGTVMDAEGAREYPVATFASGPTNSMRGAAKLSRVDDCAVVDVGGTTTDVGVLVHGFPREATTEVSIAGVRTNFRMPDVLSIGIGGGSIVRDAGRRIGPDSVGYRLRSEALVFGGGTLTATDMAVAARRAVIGDRRHVEEIPPEQSQHTMAAIAERIRDAVLRMKVTPGPLPIVAVGGGSVLLPDHLDGLGDVIRPQHFEVANAVGAAIAQVAGEVDRIVSLRDGDRASALAASREEAMEQAVLAGAIPSSVQVVDVDDVPLPYLPGNAVRIRVRAVGDLHLPTRRS